MAFSIMHKNGPILIRTEEHADPRGIFRELYRKDLFKQLGITHDFVQDNESISVKHVLRGLHYQTVKPQAKLVRVACGMVIDFAVNLDTGELTTVWLDSPNDLFYIPVGYAHGFIVMSDFAVVNYKCSEVYMPEYDRGIIWDDPDIGIAEYISFSPIISEKDSKWPTLKDAGLKK
jgi:dTDP-4-dehydrorhamnose 3,5-epimerase